MREYCSRSSRPLKTSQDCVADRNQNTARLASTRRVCSNQWPAASSAQKRHDRKAPSFLASTRESVSSVRRSQKAMAERASAVASWLPHARRRVVSQVRQTARPLPLRGPPAAEISRSARPDTRRAAPRSDAIQVDLYVHTMLCGNLRLRQSALTSPLRCAACGVSFDE